MYKIGEFSKITSLTVKALHYYDEEGILPPSLKLENNYRMYSEEDIDKAQLITLLKNFDFSIKEIKDVLKQCNSIDDDDLKYFFSQKYDIIAERVKHDKKMLSKLENYLPNNKKKEKVKMSLKVEVKELENILVISKRFNGKYNEVGTYISNLFREAKGNACGTVFDLYYNDDYAEIADIESCVPLKKSIKSDNFDVKEIEGGKFLSTLYVGPYENISVAFKALVDYANDNNLIMTVPTRLVYKKWPGMILKGNPEKYETEVLIPIKE